MSHSAPGAEQYPKRVGKVMAGMAAVAALLVLTLVFDSLLEGRRNPNDTPAGTVVDGVRKVVLEQNASGHYVATGRINGREVELLLDTGATSVAVPAELASELGLKRGPRVTVQTANGLADAYMTTLSRVELGNIQAVDVSATVVPGMGGDQVLLGMSFLKDLELNQQRGTLTLRQPAGGARD